MGFIKSIFPLSLKTIEVSVESKSIETKEEITYEQEVTSSAAVAQENVLAETADVVNAEESIKSKVIPESSPDIPKTILLSIVE